MGGRPVKLKTLQLLFRFSAGLCSVTQAVNRWAGRFHVCVWDRCSKENLRTCNERQAARERFT